MIVFIISSIIFLCVMSLVLAAQKRNERRVTATSAHFDTTMSNVVPMVQRKHTERYGRPSTALESSFPGETLAPKTKRHPA